MRLLNDILSIILILKYYWNLSVLKLINDNKKKYIYKIIKNIIFYKNKKKCSTLSITIHYCLLLTTIKNSI